MINYVFCKTPLIADIVTECLSLRLESYKLFLNTQKTQSYSRPFVSNLSLARSDMGGLIARIRLTIKEISEENEAKSIRKKTHELRAHIFDIRNVIGRYEISISNISAWYLSSLRAAVRSIIALAISSADPEMQRSYLQACESIVEGVFYVCSLDFRVRSTYTLCQTLVLFTSDERLQSIVGFDSLRHKIQDELEELIVSHLRDDNAALNGSIELFNTIIAEPYCLGRSFVTGENLFR